MSADIINPTEFQEGAQALRAGNKGRLDFGGMFYRWTNQGLTYDDISERIRNLAGVDVPAKGTVSKWRSSYQAWVNDAGLEVGKQYTHKDAKNARGEDIPLRLDGVSIEKLYLAKDAVTPDNAVDMLAQVFNATNEQEVKLLVSPEKAAGTGAEPDEPQEPTHKSLTLETGPYENFMGFVNRLRSITGNSSLSKTVTLEFMVGEVNSMSDDAIDFLWRQAHGELTDEEQEAMQQEAFDVEG